MTDFKTKRTGKFRERWVYSVLGFIFVNGGIYYSGVLFDLVQICEEKIKWKYTYLEEWTYTIVWSPWYCKWELIKIIK